MMLFESLGCNIHMHATKKLYIYFERQCRQTKPGKKEAHAFIPGKFKLGIQLGIR